jgi:hypothetical protein
VRKTFSRRPNTTESCDTVCQPTHPGDARRYQYCVTPSEPKTLTAGKNAIDTSLACHVLDHSSFTAQTGRIYSSSVSPIIQVIQEEDPVANPVLFALAVALIMSLLPAQSPQNRAQTVTVIGCVTRSNSRAVGTTGTTALEADQTRYMLTNITLAGNADPSATSDIIAQRISTYRLDDSADPVIAPHVGEKVEVTGVVQSSTEATPSARTPTAAATAAPLLKVEKLKSISQSSDSCRQ